MKILMIALIMTGLSIMYLASTSSVNAEFKIICTRIQGEVGAGFTACGVESDSCKCSYSFSVVPAWLGKTNLTLTGNNLTQLQNVYNILLKTNTNQTVLDKVMNDFSQFKNIEKHTFGQAITNKTKALPVNK